MEYSIMFFTMMGFGIVSIFIVEYFKDDNS